MILQKNWSGFYLFGPLANIKPVGIAEEVYRFQPPLSF